jgi:hypothetical protein
MKVAILDDYSDTLTSLASFGKLAGHEVTVWNDRVQDVDALADRPRDTEALVLIRERTQIREPLLERLPNFTEVHKMRMRVDQARHDSCALQVTTIGGALQRALELAALSDAGDAPVEDRHRAGTRALIVHRQHVAAVQDQSRHLLTAILAPAPWPCDPGSGSAVAGKVR